MSTDAAPKRELRRQQSSRRAVVDAAGDEIVKVGCFSRFMVKRPWVVALISFVIIIALSAVGIMSFDFGNDLVNTGWNNPESIVTKRAQAMGMLDGDAMEWSVRRLSEDEEEARKEREDGLSWLSILYDAHEGGSAFDAAGVATMIAYERALLDMPGWATHCQLVYAPPPPPSACELAKEENPEITDLACSAWDILGLLGGTPFSNPTAAAITAALWNFLDQPTPVMVNGSMAGMTPADGIVTSTEIDEITTLLLADPNVTALFQEEDQEALANLTAELPTLLNDFLGVNETHGIAKDDLTLALDTLLMPQIDDDESGDLNRAEMQAALDLIEPILGAAADGVMQALKDAIDGFDIAEMMGGGGGGMDWAALGRRRLADDAAPVRKSACATPSTVLNVLHPNASAHEEQCKEGFCMMPEDQMMLCGTVIEWGTIPCQSKVFDWRDSALLPEAEWGAAINSSLCWSGDEPSPMWKANLPVEHDCVEPSARFIRAYYVIGWPIPGHTDTDDR